MNGAIGYLRQYVEPGALPRRVRFYAVRREIALARPTRAFAIGLTLGIVSTLVAVVIMAALSGCQSRAVNAWQPREQPANERVQLWRITGRSMRPAIITPAFGMIAIGAKFEDIRRGDVITFRSQKYGVMSHRAIKRVAGGWWTKGDGNPLPDDDLATPANFVGILLVETVHQS